MEDIEIVKNVAAIAGPLTKSVIDLWIAPKIAAMGKKWNRGKKLQDHFFDNKFHNYLLERYKAYSILNILAFRNQQRLLKDVYLPLTIAIDSSPSDKIEHRITTFDKDFISTYQKILIVDTAGMGKSTISKKLFLSVVEENKGIPVFIELRRLNKKQTILNEIYKELKLINESIDSGFVLDLISRGDFIFFLDGYDEISSEDKKAVTEDLQRFVNNSSENIFILTSRPDDSLSSFGNFQSFSINPLLEGEVYELLANYDENGELSKSLISKLKEAYYRNLEEFLTNPLLVSLLYTAYEYKHTIPLKKHIFYRQVYDALFEAHDLSKGDYYHRDKLCKLSIDDFHTILRYVAFVCLKRDRIEFSKDEILDVIEQASQQCEIITFEVSAFLKDLITTVPLFVKEGLYYKWAHKSIYEYFVAQFVYQDTDVKRSVILRNLAETKYINIIDIYSNIDYRSFRNDVIEKYISEFVAYCDEGIANLKIEEDSVISRREVTFGQDLLLIQLNKSKNVSLQGAKEGRLSLKAFKIVGKIFPSNENMGEKGSMGYGIRVSNRPSEDVSIVNYTIVMVKMEFERSINEFILSTANSKKEKFVKQLQWDQKLDFGQFVIEKNTPFSINEDPKSPLNDVANFDLVNEVLAAYHEGDLVFDYLESKKFLDKQAKIREQENESGFLSIDI